MKGSRFCFVFVLCSMSVVICSWISGIDSYRGNSYRGKPAAYWSRLIREEPIPISLGDIVSTKKELIPRTVLDAVKKSLGLPYEVRFFTYPLRDGDVAAIPVLIELLRDSDPTVRMYAAETIGGFGRNARRAASMLKTLFDDHEIGAFGFSVGEKAKEAYAKLH